MRRLTPLLSAIALVIVLAAPAGAQPVSEIVDQVRAQGYAIAGSSTVDFEDLEDFVADHPDVYVVSLGEDPEGGASVLALDVLEGAGREGTVLVLGPGDVGAESSRCSRDDLDQALDAAAGRGLGDVDYARAFAGSLDCAGGGGSGLPLGILIVVVLVVVVGGLWLWSRRSRGQAQKVSVAKVKADLAEDLDDVANEILQLSDRVAMADDDGADEHYRAANALFLQVQEAWDAADTIPELDDLDDALDQAAWHLDAAEAIVEGRPVPDKPDEKKPWETGSAPAAASLPAGSLPRDLPDPPAPPAFPRPTAGRRSGGFGAGMLGGILGGILTGGGGIGVGGLPRRRGGFGYSTPRRPSRSSGGGARRSGSTVRSTGRARRRRS